MTKKVNIDIIARDKTKAALNGVSKGINRLKGQVFNLRNAFAGLGIALVGKQFIDTARSVESLRVRFKFLFGSVKEGAKAFDNLTTFAGKVPFSLDEIAGASGSLAVVAKDAEDLNRILEITGNVAAVTGLDFRTAAEQIQRSFSGGIGAADLFRERGVRALLGFKAGAIVSIEETVDAFERDFSGNGRFGKATLSLAQTFNGTLSMLGDKFFKFKLAVMDSSPFDFLKVSFANIDKVIEDNFTSIEEFAMVVGGNIVSIVKKMVLFGAATGDVLKPIFNVIKTAINDIVRIFNALPPVAQSLGIIGLLFLGKKGLGALIVVDAVLRKVGELTGLDKKIGDIAGSFEGLKKQTIAIEDIVNKPIAERSFYESALLILADLDKQVLESRKSLIDLNEIIEVAGKSTKTFGDRLRDAQDRLKIKFKGAVDSAEKAVKTFTDSVARAIVTGQSMGEVFKNVGIQILTFFVSAVLEAVIMAVFLKDVLDAIEEKLGKKEDAVKKVSNSLRSMAIATGIASTAQLLFGQQTAFTNNQLNRQLELQQKQSKMAIGSGIGGLFGGIGGAIGGIIGGFFADGGRPPIGRPSVVGERGAELFVPDSAGTIVPNNALGGGTTNVSFNITTVDADGFEDMLQDQRGTIISMINSALNEQGRPAII